MTSEKSYATEQRLNAMIGTLGPFATYQGATAWADTGSLSSGWGKGSSGFFKYRRFYTNIWLIAANSLNCTGATVADGTTILSAANAGWASPAANHIYPAYCDDLKVGVHSGPAEGAALRFNSDGSVSCLGIGTSATQVSCFAILFTDI